jgi:hypothetical protein
MFRLNHVRLPAWVLPQTLEVAARAQCAFVGCEVIKRNEMNRHAKKRAGNSPSPSLGKIDTGNTVAFWSSQWHAKYFLRPSETPQLALLPAPIQPGLR